MTTIPRLALVRQKFPDVAPMQIDEVLAREFAQRQALGSLRPGARIAVGVGSRGITKLASIVAGVIKILKAAGAEPFIIPAMGSHGGATPEGQTAVLAEYGVTEAAMGVPIRASLETEIVGTTSDGVPVHCSVEALRADGIVLINRVKPHTDFGGSLGSGVVKMLAIGLGKRNGATACHVAASRLGHEQVLRGVARVILQSAPVLAGVAIVEDQFHEPVRLAVLKPTEMEARESELLEESRRLMPRLPFDDIDLLVVDEIGKNISGAGMDPNVIGRGVMGYISSLVSSPAPGPTIRRIFARDLTAETHGNGVGIGMADVTTTRLVRAIDSRTSYVNALTALSPQSVKIPIHFDTDREALTQALGSLAMPDTGEARVVRVANTLSLACLEVSEAYRREIESRDDLQLCGEWRTVELDTNGNMLPLAPPEI